MNREGRKCVIYPRVSTEMQVEGFSLDGQKRSLMRFADSEGMEVIGVYEEAGKSGKTIEGRPEFKRMLHDIKNGLDIEYVLVYKLSRFGRNAAQDKLFLQGHFRQLLICSVPLHKVFYSRNRILYIRPVFLQMLLPSPSILYIF